ncbi:thermonuclease family protein [Thiomicrorhabdus aquaedulcis]|uniref:thermonuclease family protein n=1 Tax=Thiomicrorhabdus aquaedulcis TaxID=2211106 RepID=UPI0015628AE6|nr:thermonuclease family protein [Thiomicrorhabdus aquaedulcis]
MQTMPGTVLAADACNTNQVELWVKVSYAISGDTVVIQGQRVRLAGIQAPELERKEKFNTRGEPLAKEAQTFLNKLLANNDLEVGIEYDTTKLDAFNRTMAHLFFKDGTSVQQAMLKAGFAVARTTDDNIKYAQCYYQAEQTARTGQFQLWDFLAKNPAVHYPLVKSSEINREDGGFKIIQGKIEKVSKSGTNYILNMDTTGVRVSKKIGINLTTALCKNSRVKPSKRVAKLTFTKARCI